MTQLKTQLTLEEFLALPQGDITYELINGEAVPKMSPKRFHSKLTLVLTMLLVQWAQNLGEVGIESEMLNADTKLYIFGDTKFKKPKIVNMTSSPQTNEHN